MWTQRLFFQDPKRLTIAKHRKLETLISVNSSQLTAKSILNYATQSWWNLDEIVRRNIFNILNVSTFEVSRRKNLSTSQHCVSPSYLNGVLEVILWFGVDAWFCSCEYARSNCISSWKKYGLWFERTHMTRDPISCEGTNRTSFLVQTWPEYLCLVGEGFLNFG